MGFQNVFRKVLCMKTILACLAILLTMTFAAGCSKQESVKSSEISVTLVASGAKTKSGKSVDVYEVQIAKGTSVVLVVGGGKLEKSNPALLTLDGQMLLVDSQTLNNTVVVLEKSRLAFLPIPNVTPEDAKAKCKPNSIIDLPIDETLAALPPQPGS